MTDEEQPTRYPPLKVVAGVAVDGNPDSYPEVEKVLAAVSVENFAEVFVIGVEADGTMHTFTTPTAYSTLFYRLHVVAAGLL